MKGFWNMETKGNKKIQNWYKRGLKIVMLDEREKSENVENMRDKKNLGSEVKKDKQNWENTHKKQRTNSTLVPPLFKFGN